jgi:hypothetical protein
MVNSLLEAAMNDISAALETEREIVTFAALPDRMFCIICRAALDPVIVGGQYKVPVETGFFEYSHPQTHVVGAEQNLYGCPHAGQTFLVKLQLYEAVRVEGSMTTEQCVQVIDRLKGRWKKVDPS